jgi:hypothetical protein
LLADRNKSDPRPDPLQQLTQPNHPRHPSSLKSRVTSVIGSPTTLV